MGKALNLIARIVLGTSAAIAGASIPGCYQPSQQVAGFYRTIDASHLSTEQRANIDTFRRNPNKYEYIAKKCPWINFKNPSEKDMVYMVTIDKEAEDISKF